MSVFDDVTPEEEKEVIQKVYEYIKKKKLETAALLLLRAYGSFAPLGGALGRFFLGPIVPFMGHREEKYIWTLEKPDNLNTLIKMLENKDEEKSE